MNSIIQNILCMNAIDKKVKTAEDLRLHPVSSAKALLVGSRMSSWQNSTSWQKNIFLEVSSASVERALNTTYLRMERSLIEKFWSNCYLLRCVLKDE